MTDYRTEFFELRAWTRQLLDATASGDPQHIAAAKAATSRLMAEQEERL